MRFQKFSFGVRLVAAAHVPVLLVAPQRLRPYENPLVALPREEPRRFILDATLAGIRCRMTIREGDPRRAILNAAERRMSNLLVVGTSSRAGMVLHRLAPWRPTLFGTLPVMCLLFHRQRRQKGKK
jgi:hypothetical protein